MFVISLLLNELPAISAVFNSRQVFREELKLNGVLLQSLNFETEKRPKLKLSHATGVIAKLEGPP